MNENRPVAVLIAYPGMTLLDLVGPLQTWALAMETHVAAATLDELPTDAGVSIRPTTTFADLPRDVDVLCVPGGMGQVAAMGDRDLIDLIGAVGARATWVTSVCGGSLLLGAAGLLQGFRATSHWTALEELAGFGAQPVAERVVVDRNRITGGGVTAGIDFGLVVLARLLGEDAARLTQLQMEYDPAPPFDSGSPRTAAAEHVALAREFSAPLNEAAQRAAHHFSATLTS